MTPTVSVLIPAYNSQEFILDALSSVTAQTLGDFEVVVVDDASTDPTPQLVAGYEDPRVRVIRMNKHSGVADSLCCGLSFCRAPLVARFDSDDLCRADRLELQVAVMDERPELGAVGSAALLIGATGALLGTRRVPIGVDKVVRRLRWRNALIHPSVMFRKELVERVGGYRRSAGSFEDYDLWLRLGLVAGLDNCADPLISYRVHGSQVTRSAVGQGSFQSSIRESRLAFASARDESRLAAALRHAIWERARR